MPSSEERSDDRRGSTDGRMERAKEAALGPHDEPPSAGDAVGEAVGGITGVVTGAAIGATAGPAGLLIGGIAGALGGWWAGRAVAEAAEVMTEDDDTYFRTHFDGHPARPADRRYEDVRAVYQLGHIASTNPNFRRRTFEEVEPELERGWSDAARARHGEWTAVRDYARAGYARGAERHQVVRSDAATHSRFEEEAR